MQISGSEKMMFLAIFMKKRAADTIRLEKKKDRPNDIRTQ